MGLFNWFTQEIAIDLGTANTLIIHNDEVVVNEPSIVALNRNNPKEVLAVGKRALMMHEKTHESIRTVRPLKDGVIADFNAAELMIREFIKMVYPKKPLFPPSWRMMICIPSSITVGFFRSPWGQVVMRTPPSPSMAYQRPSVFSLRYGPMFGVKLYFHIERSAD